MKSLIFMGYPPPPPPDRGGVAFFFFKYVLCLPDTPPPPHILLGVNLLIVNYLLRNPIRSLTPVDGLYKQQISE